MTKQAKKRSYIIIAVLLVLILGSATIVVADSARATSLSDCRIVLTPDSCTYTGKAVTPEVFIRIGSQVLTEDEDYVLRYINNTDPGRASVVIAGVHDFRGVITAEYDIMVDPVKDLKTEYVGDEDVDKDAYISLSWKPSSLCDHYEIRAVKKGKHPSEKKYTTKKTKFRFTELDGSGAYDFIVTAVGGPAGSPSEEVSATALVNPLTRPEIEAESPGAGHIDISWKEVPQAQEYIVTEKSESNGDIETVTVPGGETTASFYGKITGNSYTYTVQAVAVLEGQRYEGPESESVTASPATPRIGQAIGGESGHTGNKAGDQRGGGEIATGKWSYSSKDHAWNNWKYVARFKDPEKAAIAAQAMRDACENDHIGYDQKPGNGRGELKKLAEAAGWDMTAITTKCEASCSPLVGACVCCAGIDLPAPGSTGDSDLLHPLENTGEFEILRDSKYTKSKEYLQEGDILVSPGRHTGMVI